MSSPLNEGLRRRRNAADQNTAGQSHGNGSSKGGQSQGKQQGNAKGLKDLKLDLAGTKDIAATLHVADGRVKVLAVRFSQGFSSLLSALASDEAELVPSARHTMERNRPWRDFSGPCTRDRPKEGHTKPASPLLRRRRLAWYLPWMASASRQLVLLISHGLPQAFHGRPG